MISGDLILPNTHKKYPSSIYYSLICKKRYKAIFNLDTSKKVYGSFMTYEEAFDFVKKQSSINGYNKVKNIITKIDDHYECELTKGQKMKFDFQDINFVQNFTWRCGS